MKQQVWVLVAFAVGVVLLYIIVWCLERWSNRNADLRPKRKYTYPHDDHFNAIPFKGLSFDKRGSFVNQSGHTIATFESSPVYRPGNGFLDPTRPRGVLLCIPTLGSHMERYTLLTNACSFGYATYGMDHQGFGHSAGTPASRILNNFEDLVRDVLDLASRLKQKHPSIPLFLVGHGLGGTLAALCAHRDPHMFAGLALLAPCFNPHWSTFQQTTINKLGPRFPSLQVRTVCWPPADMASSNKAVEALNESDPLYRTGRMPLGMALQIMRMIEASRKCMPQIQTPLFCQQAGKDLIARNPSSVLATCPSKVKDVYMHKESWHDLLSHPYYGPDMIQTLLDWTQDRLTANFLASTLD